MAGVAAEDDGICADIFSPLRSCDDDDDEVFHTRDTAGRQEFKPLVSASPRKKSRAVSPPRIIHSCASWSVSHRCLDCEWKSRRGGRPLHPPPPSKLGPSSPTMLTLKSLGTTRDSGYEPSPTSAFSFNFTSDEDTEVEDEVDSNTLSVEPGIAKGVTPPINIPNANPASERTHRRILPFIEANEDDNSILSQLLKDRPPPKLAAPKAKRSNFRKRSKSVPELWANEPVLPRTPIVIRSGDFRKQGKQPPVHGRNYSLPATTADGCPMFAATTPPTPGSRASRERLIDLTEEDPEGSSGHHRRVLVLALPDLLVDLDSLKKSGSFGSSSSSLLTPSIKGASPGSSSKESNQASSPEGPAVYLKPVAKAGPSEASSSSSSSSPSSGPATGAPVVLRPRPTWRRPRALSCDVTLEVEFAQELRKAADNFSNSTLVAPWEGGVFSSLRNSIGRRFSLGNICPPIHEVSDGHVTSRSLPDRGAPDPFAD